LVAPSSKGLSIRRIVRRALAPTLIAFLALAAPASALRLSPESPHSPNTSDMETAYWVMIAIALLLILVVNLGLVAALVRFRERRGRAPARFTAGRGAVRRVGVALGVAAVAIFVFGVIQTDSARTVADSGPNGLSAAASRTAQVGVKDVPSLDEVAAEQETLSQEPAGGTEVFIPKEGEPLQISAIAQQWLWRFEYPGGVPGQRTFSYGRLVVPVDTAVVLNITSTDVIHTWWVPALTGQVQAVPGTVSRTWFKADEEGTYTGQGTVFSGTSFPAMTIHVEVVDAATYQDYVEGLTADLREAQEIVKKESAAAEAAGGGEETAP
jgi:heme/copper-type cytochrome/quinol oxidase subunit 2